jgi:hypothetical protein
MWHIKHRLTHSLTHSLTHIHSVFPIAFTCACVPYKPYHSPFANAIDVWSLFGNPTTTHAGRPVGRLHDPDFPVPGCRRRITFQMAITVFIFSLSLGAVLFSLLRVSAPKNSLSSFARLFIILPYHSNILSYLYFLTLTDTVCRNSWVLLVFTKTFPLISRRRI